MGAKNRMEKYPDTTTFHFHNENPKNRFTVDCVVRAVSTGAGMPYNEVVNKMARVQCETGYDASDGAGLAKLLDGVAIKQRQPRKNDGKKYTGKEFCEFLNEHCVERSKSFICNIGGHHMACIKWHDGGFKVFDTWNSTGGCVGNYWEVI